MLIQFTVGNFKSFKEPATLSLEATSDDWLEDDNVLHIGEQRLVKSAAIYGPNAGGKSNFLAAMSWFRKMIQESSKDTQRDEPIPVSPFRLSEATENAPSHFEAVFFQNGTRYRYGFEATQEAIVSEWLFSQADSIRETRLFTRENGKIEPSDAFKEGKGLEERTRPNALFLSVVAQWNGTIAGEIMKWMAGFRSIAGLNAEAFMAFTAKRLNDPEYGLLIRELVKLADVGIENLERQALAVDVVPQRIPKGTSEPLPGVIRSTTSSWTFAVKTHHRRFTASGQPSDMVEFDLMKDESSGTQKFVALTGPFLHTLREGSVLIVDELEARLHPLLTQALVALFNGSANRKNAQLIFATHDDGLLNSKRIRRDQVWFVEKDRTGASQLYCLDEFKGVRKEAKFAKEYLLGQFGGVPRIGDLQTVLNDRHE
jgi:AAA15 family ATPase/GTPase